MGSLWVASAPDGAHGRGSYGEQYVTVELVSDECAVCDEIGGRHATKHSRACPPHAPLNGVKKKGGHYDTPPGGRWSLVKK